MPLYAVITAPNGQKLYVDPLGAAGGSSSWPAGYGATATFAAAVPDDGQSTDSSLKFALGQLPTIAAAPGPLGVRWGFWALLGLFAGAYVTKRAFFR